MSDGKTKAQNSSEQPEGYRLPHLRRGSPPGPDNTLTDEPIGFGEAALRAIPDCYYVLAILYGGVSLIFIVVFSDDLNAMQTGIMIFVTIGGSLGMLATGRLVQLVQRIGDDVRIMRDSTTDPDEPATDD